ncbi:uncharacterized protein LOC135694598 [Rhopilema esculentum]|uniref:uncharacterized protein LOC135694598 n=1 Tax=Rhopilema esculentum TaxID=499914 RepID=UPI0031DB99B5
MIMSLSLTHMLIFLLIHSENWIAATRLGNKTYLVDADSNYAEAELDAQYYRQNSENHRQNLREANFVADLNEKSIDNYSNKSAIYLKIVHGNSIDRYKSQGKSVILTLAIFVAVFGCGLGSVVVYFAWERFKPKFHGYMKMGRGKKQAKGSKNNCETNYTVLDMIAEDSLEEVEDGSQNIGNLGSGTLMRLGNDSVSESNSKMSYSLKGNCNGFKHPDGAQRMNNCTKWLRESGVCDNLVDDLQEDVVEFDRNSLFQDKQGVIDKPTGQRTQCGNRSKSEMAKQSSCNSLSMESRNNLAVNKKSRTSNKRSRKDCKGSSTPAGCFEDADSDYETNNISTDSEAQVFKSKHTFRRKSQPSWLATLDIDGRQCTYRDDGNSIEYGVYGEGLTGESKRSREGSLTSEKVNSVERSSEATEKTLRFDMNIDKEQDMNDSREELMKQWMRGKRKSIRASIYCVSSESDEDNEITGESPEATEMQMVTGAEEVIYFNYATNEAKSHKQFQNNDDIGRYDSSTVNTKNTDIETQSPCINTKGRYMDHIGYDSEEELVTTDSKQFDETERDRITLMSDHLLKGLMLDIEENIVGAYDSRRLFRSHSDSELGRSKYITNLPDLTNINSFSTSNLRSKQIIPTNSSHEENRPGSSKKEKTRNLVSKKLRSVIRFLRINRKKRNK